MHKQNTHPAISIRVCLADQSGGLVSSMLPHTQGAEGRQTRAVTHTTDHLTNLAQNQHCKLTHIFIGWGRELSHISHPISAGINGLVERATPALQQLFVLVLQERRGRGRGRGRRGKVSDQTCLNITRQLIHPRRVHRGVYILRVPATRVLGGGEVHHKRHNS